MRTKSASGNDSSGPHLPSLTETKQVDCRHAVYSVAFLGNDVLSGGSGGLIKHRQDGTEAETPIDAGYCVCTIVVSRDGRWIIGGTQGGGVMVWDAAGSYQRVGEFRGHIARMNAVDVSPDGTKIATGSSDCTARVWSFSTGQLFFGPLQHDFYVVAAKFSPDGFLVATATLQVPSVRVYNHHNGHLLVNAHIRVGSLFNNSLAWARGGKQLFALSQDGNIHCLDVLTGATLSKWCIHSTEKAICIALTSNGKALAASAGRSISFWDPTTQKQIGYVVKFTHTVLSMAISESLDLVASGGERIFLRSLRNTLSASHTNIHATEVEKTVEVPTLEESTNSSANVNQKLPNKLARCQNAACEQTEGQNETIESLRSDLRAQGTWTEDLEKINQELRHKLATAEKAKDRIVRSLCEQEHASSSTITVLEQTIQNLRDELENCRPAMDKQQATNNTLRNRITLLECANQHLLQQADSLHQIIQTYEQRHLCESLYAQGRISDAAELVLEMTTTMTEDLKGNELLSDWLAEFTRQCIKTLEANGDEASDADKRDEAVRAYTTALLLHPSTPNDILTKLAKTTLVGMSAHEALNAATKFGVPRFDTYCVICDILEGDGRFVEAAEFLQHIQDEVPNDTSALDEREQWQFNFRQRCVVKLEKLGDLAKDSQKHDEALGYYTDALSFKPMNLNSILLKHSNELIELDPASYRGYEEKHAALHGMGHYHEAFEAFRTMLSILERSVDPKMRDGRRQYVDATRTIQLVVEETIQDLPQVLIDTETGELYDRSRQAAAFEGLPIFDELRSSMTTELDHSRIWSEVKEFYRYVMLSHKWQPDDPTFQQVEKNSVYKLPSSPGFDKLRNFCKLVCSLQFKWAWSDTCCINQLDKGVQQESIVAMFRWYRGSSLTIVHLLGVPSESQEEGRLWRSIWNTRGWTYQEYVASMVVQFYTEDWKPYLGLGIFNHKDSPVILQEMERAVNLGTQQVTTLRPGLDRVREKLYLASGRKTTREEDTAYSLFGIFNAALPVIYGEGNQAVDRLLEYVLTRSDDVTLLAWTGRSGSHHSYLPSSLAVYNQIVPPHVPPHMKSAEMDNMVKALRSSLLDLSIAIALYQRLYEASLHPLSLAPGRLRLHGIAFPLTDLVHVPQSNPPSDLLVYRATSPMLGNIEIKTTDDLTGTDGLILVHPWIDPLLDQDFLQGIPQFDLATRALRLVVRLKQPFGALLFAPRARAQYRRVATDSLIMVRVLEKTSLSKLMDGVRTVDVQ